MTPRKRNIRSTMEPPESGVTVRMYNTGFGDCFLLAFRDVNAKARYMLIDCGAHHQYPNKEERLKLVAEDIAEATGKHLHVLAVTHEHTDHLDGFGYARDVFKEFTIDDLWLAWTEDPEDRLAKRLKEKYGRRSRALRAAVAKLSENEVDNDFAATVRAVMDFEVEEAFSAAAKTNAAQLVFLREISENAPQRAEDYRSPQSPPATLDGVDGVRFFVLGPPKDLKAFRILEDEDELYLHSAWMGQLDVFAAAVLGASNADDLSEEDQGLITRAKPFEERFSISQEEASVHPEFKDFFIKRYGFSSEANHSPEWRRIGTEWLETTKQLALSINSKTNNTSLALALELTDTYPRKVLLFAADAQVGNWLSWHDLEWEDKGPDGEIVHITAEDLLRRTVLYKVGHHGSHNATLREKGLELMDSRELVAMIPVDEVWANEEQHWQHPAEKLLDRLEEKTRGRIIRTDMIPGKKEQPPRPEHATEREWRKFLENLDWDKSEKSETPLWIQYTVK